MPHLSGPPFHRYVALGGSFTEGVGDHDLLRGTSSGDGLAVRRPALEPVHRAS
jgi:hypothetical protein